GAFASLVLRNIYLALTRSPVPLSCPNLAENFLATVFIVCFIAAFLKLRGIDIDSLGGFSKTSLKRALSTAVILLLAATPLILVAEAITQNAFGGGSSRQETVDLVNSSQTIETSPVRQRTDSLGRGWRRCANRVVAGRAAGTAQGDCWCRR